MPLRGVKEDFNFEFITKTRVRIKDYSFFIEIYDSFYTL